MLCSISASLLGRYRVRADQKQNISHLPACPSLAVSNGSAFEFFGTASPYLRNFIPTLRNCFRFSAAIQTPQCAWSGVMD